MLKLKHLNGFLLSIFYAVVGILQIVVLVLSSPTLIPPHVGALAIISLIAAYGLFKTRKWSVWLVIALFFPQLTFAAATLYVSYSETSLILLNIALTLFIALLFISFVYVAAKRKTFQ
jgi:uncharacterized membrane protein (DUF2068 family)